MASTIPESVESVQLAEIRKHLMHDDVRHHNPSMWRKDLQASSHTRASNAAMCTDTDILSQQGKNNYDEAGTSLTSIRAHAVRAQQQRHKTSVEEHTDALQDAHDDKISRRVATRRDQVPRLIPTKSSPIVPTAMEGTQARMRMLQSFAGFVDAGDTQPMDSQIYKNFTSSPHVPRDEGGDVSQVQMGGEEDDEVDPIGDNGEIDLLSEWDHRRGDDNLLSFGDHEMSDLSPETQSRVKAATDATFRMPKTPAMAGNKRKYSGQIVSSVARTDTRTSASKTPGSELAAMFGQNAGKNLISLTQAFNQTQAPSSPLPEGIRSDPIFERPSPNLVRYQHSSPIPRTSSPNNEARLETVRASTEPLESYRTMKESQESRARRIREEERRLAEVGLDDELDEEWRIEEIEAERRRLHARLSSEALNNLDVDRLLGGSRPSSRAKEVSSRPNSRPATAQGLQNFNTKTQPVIEIADDESVDEFEEEQSVEKAKSTKAARGATAVEIPMTSSRNDFGKQVGSISSSSPLKGRMQSVHDIPATASQPEHVSQSAPKATQTIAVADSQKERGESQKENDDPDADIQLPGQPRQDSIEAHRIVQSQYSISSNTRDILEAKIRDHIGTSSILDPPPTTSQVQEATRSGSANVPSSPPMLTSDAQDDEELAEDANDDVDRLEADSDLADAFHPAKRKRLDNEEIANDRTSIPETSVSGAQQQSRSLRSRGKAGAETGATSTTGPTGTSGSGVTTLFHTARSRQTPSPTKRKPSDVSPRKAQTPRSTRARKLTEIAADPTPNLSFEQMDIDIDLMTTEDAEFTNLMSGSSPVLPARKKRKVYSAKKPHNTQPTQLFQIPPNTPSSARRQNVEGAAAVTPLDVENQEDEQASPTNAARRSAQREVPAALRTNGAVTFQQPQPAPRRPGKLTRPSRKTPARLQALKPDTASNLEFVDPEMPRSEVTETPQLRSRPIVGSTTTTTTSNATQRVEEPVAEPEIDDRDGSVEKLTPNRVFARFRGLNNYYHPATCLEAIKGEAFRLKIRFDDETIDFIEPHYVGRLELRTGDVVKVDLPSMKKDHVIMGFKDRINPTTSIRHMSPKSREAAQFPATDEAGFRTVVLAAKQRDSVSTPAPAAPSETIDVPITNVYLTTTMWSHFKDRTYTHPTSSIAPASTPTNPAATSVPPTPASRSRRATVSMTNEIRTRDSSTSSFRQESNLFANMAFAVSFKDENSSDRKSTIRSIAEHGAVLLDYGFDSLFILPELDKAHHDTGALSGDPLTLNSSSTNLGFVALVTEVHSRRPKYLQALALGLPCLHYRWVQDCVAAKTVLSWEKYLLPAGESAWLGGVVRSRLLPAYPATDADFAETVTRREKLLSDSGTDGQAGGVLLVEPGNSGVSKSSGRAKSNTKKGGSLKALDDRRMHFLFMTYAIGATRFRRVKDLKEARDALEDSRGADWGWVFVDGEVGAAERALGFNGAADLDNAGMGRKRKRGEDYAGHGFEVGRVMEKKVKVVSDEFVIQSLILGALAD